MLLFKKAFHEGLKAGDVTITIRRWKKPHVKPGGRYRCHPIGVLEVDSVERIRTRDLRTADAKAAGFETRRELIEYLRSAKDEPLEPSSELYRVRLHYGGDGDRVSIALDDKLTADDVQDIQSKLDRMDKKGPWTAETLAVIAKHPQIAASKLAAKLGRERDPFKVNVRKLKKLGLTQSFEVGYEISPRGQAFMKAARRRRR